MKKIYFLSVVLVSGLFLGCTPIYQAKEIHLLPPIDKVDFNNTNKLYQHESWAKKKRPFLGIALSGGGSKMSPFAMGVLKRFVDKDTKIYSLSFQVKNDKVVLQETMFKV